MARTRQTSDKQALAALRLALLVPLALLIAGCGRGKGSVSGEVTCGGQPIPWGRITFLGQEGNKITKSAPIVNGKYTIKDCPAGLVKIGVESFKAEAIGKNVPAAMVERSKEAGWVEPPAEVIGKFLKIPGRYADPDKSGLEYTVEKGSDTHNVSLERK